MISGGKIMKTTLSTKTHQFHIIISIVLAGLILNVGWTMADQQFSPKEKVNTDQAFEMNSTEDNEPSPSKDNAASDPQAYVTFNTVDMDIIDFIEHISAITGKTFIVDGNIRGRVNVVSPEKITQDEAYRLFESVLEVNGFTLVPAGKFIKVVPASEANTKNIETLEKK